MPASLLELDLATGLGADANKLTLHVGTQQFTFADATYNSIDQSYSWRSFPSWSAGDSVQVKITGPPLPNAYGYRTIWTALMTADSNPTILLSDTRPWYWEGTACRRLTNNLIVTGRDETVTIGTPGQPRYPWTGYEIEARSS